MYIYNLRKYKYIWYFSFQVFIAFDALSCRCFHEVNKYVKDSLNNKKRGTYKKRVSSDGNEKKKSNSNNNKSKSRKSSSNTSVDDDDNDDDDNNADADDD